MTAFLNRKKTKPPDYIICLRSFPLLVKDLEKELGFSDFSDTLLCSASDNVLSTEVMFSFFASFIVLMPLLFTFT